MIMRRRSLVKNQLQGEMEKCKQERGEAARHWYRTQTEHVSLLQLWRQGIVLQRELE